MTDDGSSSSLLLKPVHDKHYKRLFDYVCLLCGHTNVCGFAGAGVPGCPGPPHGAGWT